MINSNLQGNYFLISNKISDFSNTLGPVFPIGPAVPACPGPPGSPFSPGGPLTPRGPGLPRGPMGPVGPCTPLGPSGPGRPWKFNESLHILPRVKVVMQNVSLFAILLNLTEIQQHFSDKIN